MKTKEELNQIKKEIDDLSNKLMDLSEDELKEVTGGEYIDVDYFNTWEVIPTITGCKFEGNKSSSTGGAIYYEDQNNNK